MTAQTTPFPAPCPVIVFSDLDGTLLDHHDYGYAPARPTLDRLRRNRIPLVLASSKTAAEMVPLRAELGFADCPLIVENGAGCVEGGAKGGSDDAAYRAIQETLSQVPGDLRAEFEGFADMSVDRVRAVTGLSDQAARLARLRQFSEPGLWTGPAARLDAFLHALKRAGVVARRGGRFLTLSHGATKADQMHRIARAMGARRTIALGDAPNDAEMLEAADHAIILPNPQGAGLGRLRREADGAESRVIRAAHPGPAGWNEALGALLDRLNLPG